MDANKKYKNSVFSLLFSDPEVLKELYCALEGVTLPVDVAVTINTLQNVLFMDKINDISFEIGGKLVVLIEHQSTINPNMALRLLMYIARIYEKLIDNRKIYSRKKLTIPQPEFFVLYNGKEPYPDEVIVKLSDTFENINIIGLPDKEIPVLELIVKVININKGKNEEIVQKCKTLSGYSTFTGKIREYEKEGCTLTEALKKGIQYCSEHDILKEFLESNSSEVMNMLMTEWNLDDAKEVWFEEGKEEGREEGRKEGREKGRKEGRKEGQEEGREEGREEEREHLLALLDEGLPLEEIKKRLTT